MYNAYKIIWHTSLAIQSRAYSLSQFFSIIIIIIVSYSLSLYNNIFASFNLHLFIGIANTAKCTAYISKLVLTINFIMTATILLSIYAWKWRYDRDEMKNNIQNIQKEKYFFKKSRKGKCLNNLNSNKQPSVIKIWK